MLEYHATVKLMEAYQSNSYRWYWCIYYNWTDQDGNAVTANDQGNLENIGAGTYTAVVTDENGCSDTVTVEITENENARSA